jgi:CHAT domain-containing protein
MRLLQLFVLILVLIAASSARSETLQVEKDAAYLQFHHGKLTSAIATFRGLIERAPDVVEKATLQRDLMEMCATAADWRCVDEMVRALLPLVNSGPRLAALNADVRLYAVKLFMRLGDQASVEKLVENGPFSLIATSHPMQLAQLQLALHDLYIQRGDFKAAESAMASANVSLLLSDPKASYEVSRILVETTAALLQAQDIVGASALWAQSDPFIARSVSHDNFLYARHRSLTGELYAHTNAFADAAAILSDAADLLAAVEIDEDSKAYQVCVANALATAAFVLAGKLEEARQNHSKNPMQSRRDAILQRGEFQTYTEFYFAVADVFVQSVSHATQDTRWQALFEKAPRWGLGDVELANINSYRSFALGLLALSGGRIEEGNRLVVTAAKQRVDSFEAVMQRNFEGFQLASVVDKIIIGVGLSAAMTSDAVENAELLLRGSEIINRNLRHAVADTAVLVQSQDSVEARKRAHSFLQLLQQKREWEDSKRRELLDKGAAFDKRPIFTEYPAIVAQLADMKQRLAQDRSVAGAQTLPTVQSLQRALGGREVFVTFFPTSLGFGKLCVGKSAIAYADTREKVEGISRNIKLLRFATTASYPPDPALDAQYPVSSALYLRNLLFGGLEKCLTPGASVIVALPDDFSDVPLGALLSESPPATEHGYDLARARWLIKDFSFSTVISARQYIAVAQRRIAKVAERPFLGVGDPVFSAPQLAQLEGPASPAAALRQSKEAAAFDALPETREELSRVGQVMRAAKSDILLGKAASEEAMRQKLLAEYDVIHFATHGVMGREVAELDESALLLSSGVPGDSYNDGVLSASEIAKLTLNARLVVLSACNSAKYDVRQATLGVHDLYGAFTVAGAPTLLASLWPIDSSTARDLIVTFFQDWRSGRSGGAAQSLASATRSFLQKADAAHQHPRFWSSFVIVGYGAISGSANAGTGVDASAFEPVRDIAGDVVQVVKAGTSLITATSADYDGKKFAHIISQRDENGRERWSVSSRDVGEGKLVVASDRIYAAGFLWDGDSIPVIRQFDLNGRLLWRSEFPKLRGYMLADLVPLERGILTIATPRHPNRAQPAPAILMQIDSSGRTARELQLPGNDEPLVTVRRAALARFGRSIVVAVNRGTSSRLVSNDKSRLGLPSVCYENGRVDLTMLDAKELTVAASKTIPGAHIAAMSALGDRLYLAGEALDRCSFRGKAVVFRLTAASNDAQLFWKDDDLAISSVRGLAIASGQLTLAVGYQRTLAVELTKLLEINMASKRGQDDDLSILDASIIQLSDKDGSVSDRHDLSAGLKIHLYGVELVGGKPIAYGSLGGQPAMTAWGRAAR